MYEPTPKSTYATGECVVRTYHDSHHELWHYGKFVAAFRSFRSAVRYQLEEFP